MTSIELPILSCKTQVEWRHWLDTNHETALGAWLRFFKKSSGITAITYDEALDEALCFGWIDGQSKSYDETSWLQRYTPRRKKSLWSKRNTEHVERLLKIGKMQAAGLKEIELAKADGRWEAAYDSAGTMAIPEDFLHEVQKHKETLKFFQSLNKSNLYAIAWRLQTAKKPETRTRRMKIILEMLAKKEKFHP